MLDVHKEARSRLPRRAGGTTCASKARSRPPRLPDAEGRNDALRRAKTAGCPTGDGQAIVQSIIDGWATRGVTYLYYDEPHIVSGDMTPCCDDPSSVPYNVQGYNFIADYMHAHYPWMKMGITTGADPSVYKAIFDQAAIVVPGGFHMDFIELEYYEILCCASHSKWSDFHRAYPTVQRFILLSLLQKG